MTYGASPMGATAARRYTEVGARIRDARKARGLSQERFAPIIGITRRHLIRLENGEHLPSAELRGRIAKHTDAPAASFSLDEDDEESDPMAALMNALRRVVREEMAQVTA